MYLDHVTRHGAAVKSFLEREQSPAQAEEKILSFFINTTKHMANSNLSKLNLASNVLKSLKKEKIETSQKDDLLLKLAQIKVKVAYENVKQSYMTEKPRKLPQTRFEIPAKKREAKAKSK